MERQMVRSSSVTSAGQFKKGNKGGPGNPFAPQVAEPPRAGELSHTYSSNRN